MSLFGTFALCHLYAYSKMKADRKRTLLGPENYLSNAKKIALKECGIVAGIHRNVLLCRPDP